MIRNPEFHFVAVRWGKMLLFKRRLGEGADAYGIAAGQRFRSRGAKSMLWEVSTIHRYAWEPTPHVRLRRVGVPGDLKTVALDTLRDERYFEPVN
jgi:hypothetical protein